MTDEAVEFASLMCSRLCHDLLSPVGSFGNGLELLADEPDPEMRKRFVGLLEASSRSAINKLKFFRLAFGSSGGYGESIAPADIREAVRGLIAEGRDTELRWIGAEAAVPKPAARVLLLLTQLVVESLVRGGTIDLAMEMRDGMLEIAARGSGDRVLIDAASEAAFGPDPQPTPKSVGIALARRIAAESGGQVMLSRPSDKEVVVGAVIPV